jgi:hypothetical protein
MGASMTFWIIAGLHLCAYQPSERTAFLPLFAAFGAAGNMRAERLHSNATYSVLRMTSSPSIRRIRLWRSDRASIPI